MILNAADSSLLNFTLTGSDGAFRLKTSAGARLLLKITFVGYKTYGHAFEVQATDVWDLGTITMRLARTALDEVVIEGSRPPVVVNKDTIEFNATAFKTNPNATVEDLLKKMPGVEVDNDGTIRAQGEEVRRVMVDGKNFFGADPKIASRNLPADAIDKVQVFDKKSDQAAFTGVDDGQREKTINLELKESKRKGAFGQLQGGVGSDERFQAKANINRFRKEQQLSVLGMANNTNDNGFSIDDYLGFTGGAQQMMRGGRVRLEVQSDNESGVPLNLGGRTNGLLTNVAGGINFNKDISRKTELNASYFANYLDHDITQSTERINFLPAGDVNFNQFSRRYNTNGNHRMNASVEHRSDSSNTVKWTTTATYNETKSDQYTVGENTDTNGQLSSVSDGSTKSEGYSANTNNTLLWRHRFARKGRNLSLQLQLNAGVSDRDDRQDAVNTFYGDHPDTLQVHQQGRQESQNHTVAATFTYVEPLGNRRYLEATYAYRQAVNDVDKDVYDEVNENLVYNTDLSNSFSSDYRYQRAGVNFRLNRRDWRITMGGVFQQTSLYGNLRSLGETLSQAYSNLLPVVRFAYDFSDSRHIQFDYETSVQEPSIDQLQPVIDNTDQLNWYVGNPNLRPAYEHNGRLNFIMFDPSTFINVFAFLSGSYTRNAVVTSQSYTSEQVRVSQPVNADHATQLMADATVGFPIQKPGSRLSLSASISRDAGVNVVENVETHVAEQVLGFRFRYDYRFKDVADASLGANIRRESSQYELASAVDQLFFTKTFTAEANVNFLKAYLVASSLEYLLYESKTSAYEQAVPLWNISLSRYLLKAKSGELKFSVVNVLDRRVGVSQSTDANYFERQLSNGLGRYFMVSFIYALNKQLNPMPMAPRGGMRMMRRG